MSCLVTEGTVGTFWEYHEQTVLHGRVVLVGEAGKATRSKTLREINTKLERVHFIAPITRFQTPTTDTDSQTRRVHIPILLPYPLRHGPSSRKYSDQI